MQSSELVFPTSLVVTEQTIDISSFSPRQKAHYQKLFWDIVQVYNAAKKSRIVIGMAGPTGAGKSVLAVLIKELAKQAHLPFAFEVITIDAYHYPNSYLLTHFSEGVPLKKVKGRFDTYDVQALARNLREFVNGENIAFPSYSRKLHDPVPNSVLISKPETLLLIEGLWLLSDQWDWNQIRPLLNYCYFIESDKARTRDAVIRRHITGGRSLEDAARHYEQVDGHNSDLVLQTHHKADKIIAPYYLVA